MQENKADPALKKHCQQNIIMFKYNKQLKIFKLLFSNQLADPTKTSNYFLIDLKHAQIVFF